MVEVKMIFPVEADAHKFHLSISKFFQGSDVFINDNVIINPVKRGGTDERPLWFFLIDICVDNDDMEIEKYVEINGGTLNLMNGTNQVWAFSK